MLKIGYVKTSGPLINLNPFPVSLFMSDFMFQSNRVFVIPCEIYLIQCGENLRFPTS